MAYTFAVMQAGQKGRRLKMNDFLLRWAGRKKVQSSEDQLNIFRALAAKQEAAAKAANSK